MHAKRVLFFLLLFAFSFKAYPAIFVVTSNADSGPGTLRDALTQAAANGSAVKDYINFNLPDLSLTERTITLLSQLPNVSSNLVIDGTTQSGRNLNMGDAKVNITVNRFSYFVTDDFTGALILDNVTDVEIYGLSINGFHFLRNNYLGAGLINAGIYIANSLSVTIGAPNKGNYFQNNDYDLYSGIGNTNITSPVNIKIQSNYFGFQSTTLSYVPQGPLLEDSNLLFGGDNALEGNHLVGVLSISGSNIQLVHNYFGVDENGNPSKYVAYVGISYSSDVLIRNNISNQLDVNLQNTNGFNIYANTDLGSGSNISGVSVYECSNGVIGSEDINQQNVFQGNQYYAKLNNQDSNNIQILKNSITCSGVPYNLYLEIASIIAPNIKVSVNNSTEFSGTASPNSAIYIYKDNTDCPICNPVVFVTKIIADAAGNWKFIGNFTGVKLLANALLNQNSSEFTVPQIPRNDMNGVLNMPSCGKNTGSITIKNAPNVLNIEWYNADNVKVGEGSEVDNLAPGSYYAKGYNGNCVAKSAAYNLYNIQPQIYADYLTVTSPSCGKGGSIVGLITATGSQNAASYVWTDANNNIVGKLPNVYDLTAGKYLLTMTDIVTKCSVTYGPVILQNTTGPNIDQSKVAIQPTNCGQSTGSISNLVVTGTGTLKYSWLNDQQQLVATSADLTNQPAGAYKLQVTDDTQCGPIFSSDFEIPELNGITLDESNVKIVIASCSINNGSVTGIKVDGATQYQWLDANNKVVATTPDLQNAAAGDYMLTASNSYGCTETSKPYHIGQQLPTQFPVYTDVIASSCFGDNSGSVSVTTDALVKSLRWQNSQGQTISTATDLTGVATGVYQLYLTDQNGCESLYQSFTVPELNRFTVAQAGQVTNDQCGLKTGSVTATTVSGGLPPYTYKWVDAVGAQIGSGSGITNLAKGSYTLNIIDSKCGNIDINYTINEQTEDITAPSVNNAQLCSSGAAVLTVNNPVTSDTYRLYNSQTSTQPLDEQTGDSFTVNVTNSRSYFISQLTGTCESPRTEVKVTVGISALNIINTFTPNGDGINDYWKITGIENYPDATVRVFNRYGQKEFDSKGYAVPFDGKHGGKPLPAGVYYYIINLSNSCNMLSGSLTIIR